MRALRLFDRRSLSAGLLMLAAPLGCESPDQAVNARRVALEDGGSFVAVDSCAELQAMEQDLDGVYVLTANIDCTGFDAGDGKGFRPVGSGGTTLNPFTGMLDGDGHVISGLTINRQWTSFVGLFGYTYQAQIQNVGLASVTITGFQGVGGLVGVALETDVSQAFVTGTVTGTTLVGGLVGEIKGATSSLLDSYSTAAVNRSSASGQLGLVSSAVRNSAAVSRAYSAGTVSSGATAALATLIDTQGTVTSSFFDCTVAGNCGGAGAAATSAMQTEAQYTVAGWDFANVWGFSAANTYPCLRWQAGCGQTELDTDGDGTPDAMDGCPEDPLKVEPAECGCGVVETSPACVGGSPCTSSAECNDRAMDERDWWCANGLPGGYCALDCDGSNSCPEGLICLDFMCVVPCATGATCARDTLECSFIPGDPTTSAFCRPTCEQECDGGTWCDPDVGFCEICESGADPCDGRNTDCDGQTDESFESDPTSCGVGACASTGATACQGGDVVNTCAPGTPASSDASCNDIDDDCDGRIDENDDDGDPCTTTVCTGGSASHVPMPEDADCSATDRCADGLDNDGDSNVDCDDADCAGEPACSEDPHCADDIDNDGDGAVDCADDDCTGMTGCVPEVCGNSLDDDGDGLSDCADPDCEGTAACPPIPPSPEDVAPEIDQTLATTFADAVSFIYEGSDPIQRGVTPGVIEENRTALVKGRILDDAGNGIAGVRVAPLFHDELGYTHTTESGEFVFVANGGGPLVLSFEHAGYISAQRQLDAEWNDTVTMSNVILVEASPIGTAVDMTGATSIQVARGPVESDADGDRQATLLFPPSIRAQVTLADGTIVPMESVETLTIRATEFTVGENGRARMPADIPANIQYTYALDLSADGAASVEFDQPIPFYVENFIGFPVGSPAPLGYYDEERGVWVAADSGIALRIVGMAAGHAQLDLTGDGVADTGSELATQGITTAETAKLAELYAVGANLWRVRIPHFSTWDINLGMRAEDGADFPNGGTSGSNHKKPCDKIAGSVIHCQSGVLQESISLPGTDVALHYSSDRVSGASRAIDIRLGTAEDLSTLPFRSVTLDIEPAGGEMQSIQWPAAQVPQLYTWTWNPSILGQRPIGAHDVEINIRYHYGCTYGRTERFGYNGVGLIETNYVARMSGSGGPAAQLLSDNPLTGEPCRTSLRQTLTAQVQSLDYRVTGIGGWDLTPHHFYDPEAGILIRGDGQQLAIDALPKVWRTVELTHPALAVDVEDFQPSVGGVGFQNGVVVAHMSFAPNGTLWTSANGAVSRLNADGTSELLTSAPPYSLVPENGDPLSRNRGFVELASDGTPYLATRGRIYRIKSDQTLERVIGQPSGTPERFLSDGDDASTGVLRNPHDFTIGPDGTFYLTLTGFENQSNGYIVAVDTSGRYRVVAGVESTTVTSIVDGAQARETGLNFPTSIAIDSSGNIYAVVSRGREIIRIDSSGRVWSIAGRRDADALHSTIPIGNTAKGDIIPPVHGLAIDKSDRVFFNTFRGNVLYVDGNGILRSFLGKAESGPCHGYDGRECTPPDEGSPILGSTAPPILAAAFSPDGLLYFQTGMYPTFSTSSDNGVARLNVASPQDGQGIGVLGNAAEIILPSADGSELFVFDNAGRHRRTESAATREAFWTFAYDSSGFLRSMTDGDGNVTTVERDSSGDPTAVVGPYGHRTTLDVNSHGYLSSVELADGEQTYALSYSGDDGFLTGMIDPRAGVHAYDYDEKGLLISDTGTDGRTVGLERETSPDGVETITVTESGAGARTLTIDQTVQEQVVSISQNPDGTTKTTTVTDDGVTEIEHPDGSQMIIETMSDPVYGLKAPMTRTTIVLPSGLTKTIEQSVAVDYASSGAPALDWTSRTTTTTINGKSHSQVFDRATNTWTAVSAEGRTATATTDGMDRLLTISEPGIEALSFDYDADGRLSAVAHGAGSGARAVSYGYWNDASHPDRQGFLREVSGPRSTDVTEFESNALGEVELITNAEGGQTLISYSPLGHVDVLSPPGRPAHDFDHDATGLLRAYTAPPVASGGLASVSSYDYDLARRPTAFVLPDGLAVLAHYHPVTGRVESVTAASWTSTFSYYPTTGQAESILSTDALGTRTLGFQHDGPLLTKQTWSGAGQVAGSVDIVWNADFQPEHIEINDASIVHYQYDDDGFLTNAGPMVLSRDPLSGRLDGTTLASITTANSYSSLGESSDYTVEHGAALVYRNQILERDDGGRITSREETIAVDAVVDTTILGYDYDAVGRLESVTASGSETDRYTYNANGNRLTHTTSIGTVHGRYDEQDRLIRYCPEDGTGAAVPLAGLPCFGYAYNRSGQLEEKTDLANGDQTSFEYDERGNLRRVVTDGSVIDYEIDALNRRVGKRVNGVIQRRWLYANQLEPVAELGPSNEVISTFIYATASHAPDFVVRNGVTYRVVTDALGSIRMIVNTATGAVAQRLDYDEFGNVQTGGYSAPGFSQPFGFAGGLYDADTGLVRFGARDYDAVTGRWTTKDPILFRGGTTNLYEYAKGDPVNYIDPDGRVVQALICAAVAVTIGVAILNMLNNSAHDAARYEKPHMSRIKQDRSDYEQFEELWDIGGMEQTKKQTAEHLVEAAKDGIDVVQDNLESRIDSAEDRGLQRGAQRAVKTNTEAAGRSGWWGW